MQIYKVMVFIMIVMALHTAFTDLDVWGLEMGGVATYNMSDPDINITAPDVRPPDSGIDLLLYGMNMLYKGAITAANAAVAAVTLYPIMLGDSGIPSDLVPFIVFPIYLVYAVGIAQIILKFKVED